MALNTMAGKIKKNKKKCFTANQICELYKSDITKYKHDIQIAILLAHFDLLT